MLKINIMTKRLTYIHWAISVLYIVLNFEKIRGAFRSDVWSKEIDLINHVTNYTVHLQVISILLVIIGAILLWAYFKDIPIAKFILVPLVVITLILFMNTQFDFIRWIEINVFGSGGLLVFTITLLINVFWRMMKPVAAET